MPWKGEAKVLVDKVTKIPRGTPQELVSRVTLALAMPYIVEQLERIADALEERDGKA